MSDMERAMARERLPARLTNLKQEIARLAGQLKALRAHTASAPSMQTTHGSTAANSLGILLRRHSLQRMRGWVRTRCASRRQPEHGLVGVAGAGTRSASIGESRAASTSGGGSSGTVYVASRHAPAVYAEASKADAVVASSLHASGVHAVGGGVRGGFGETPRPCGVFAEGGNGDGLYATSEEIAVHGVSPGGYGAAFAGGLAPLRLVPAATNGAPTTGAYLPGTLFVDADALLWLCIAGGAPGTWRQVVVR